MAQTHRAQLRLGAPVGAAHHHFPRFGLLPGLLQPLNLQHGCGRHPNRGLRLGHQSKVAQQRHRAVGAAAAERRAVVALGRMARQRLGTAARQPTVGAPRHGIVIGMLSGDVLAQHILEGRAVPAARVRGSAAQSLARVQPHVRNHRVLSEGAEAAHHAAVREHGGWAAAQAARGRLRGPATVLLATAARTRGGRGGHAVC